MLLQVAIGAERHEIVQAVVTQLAKMLPMVHLKVLHGSARLAAPVISIQHPPQQTRVGSHAELDTLDFFSTAAVSRQNRALMLPVRLANIPRRQQL